MSFSEETICFSAQVYMENRNVAYVRNAGCGANNSVFWNNEEAKKEFEEMIKDVKIDGYSLNEDFFFSLMVDNMLAARTIKRKLKKPRTYFVKEGGAMKLDRYLTASPSSPKVTKYLNEKYPNAKILTINDLEALLPEKEILKFTIYK